MTFVSNASTIDCGFSDRVIQSSKLTGATPGGCGASGEKIVYAEPPPALSDRRRPRSAPQAGAFTFPTLTFTIAASAIDLRLGRLPCPNVQRVRLLA
jgi:hypothetical protein